MTVINFDRDAHEMTVIYFDPAMTMEQIKRGPGGEQWSIYLTFVRVALVMLTKDKAELVEVVKTMEENMPQIFEDFAATREKLEATAELIESAEARCRVAGGIHLPETMTE